MSSTGSKKNIAKFTNKEKSLLIEPENEVLSIRQQCGLLGLNRSNLYYKPHPRLYHDLDFREKVMRRIDHWNTSMPAWGAKMMIHVLKNEGLDVSRELFYELAKEMGVVTIYPHFNTSKADKNARKKPYLLRKMRKDDLIFLPNLVWATDITYIQVGRSHMYLTAIIDWFSRFIVGWELADTLSVEPVIMALERAFEQFGIPGIINTDQGSQYTGDEYVNFLKKYKIRQSMDGKGRWADNVIIERFFRSLKTEEIYPNAFETPRELKAGIAVYMQLYNDVRTHESLDYHTPKQIYNSKFQDS